MNKRIQNAFSLVELIVAMATMSIVILAMGGLLVNGQRIFQQTYDSVHKPVHEDSIRLMSAFGAVGRKSNRSNYKIYQKEGGVYSVAVPKLGESMAKGQAVEFRFWAKPFYENTEKDTILEVSNTGSEYALFYLQNGTIKVDYGTVVEGVGGITGGGMRNTNNIQTRVLAEDVDVNVNRDIFSHVIVGGRGSGCVNLNVTLEDDDEEKVEILTATLLRADWPR